MPIGAWTALCAAHISTVTTTIKGFSIFEESKGQMRADCPPFADVEGSTFACLSGQEKCGPVGPIFLDRASCGALCEVSAPGGCQTPLCLTRGMLTLCIKTRLQRPSPGRSKGQTSLPGPLTCAVIGSSACTAPPVYQRQQARAIPCAQEQPPHRYLKTREGCCWGFPLLSCHNVAQRRHVPPPVSHVWEIPARGLGNGEFPLKKILLLPDQKSFAEGAGKPAPSAKQPRRAGARGEQPIPRAFPREDAHTR
jgi:hypothetical protein